MSGFFAALRAGKVSLRLLLVVPFLLQIAAAVGLTGWFSWHNGQQAVKQLIQQHQIAVVEQIGDRLQQQLAIAPLALQLIQADFKDGVPLSADPNDPESWAPAYLTQQLQRFPALSGLAIAPALDPGWVITRNPQGQPRIAPLQTGDRERWYRAVAQRGQPQWQRWPTADRPPGLEAERLDPWLSWPVYNGAGQLWGAIAARVDLGAVQVVWQNPDPSRDREPGLTRFIPLQDDYGLRIWGEVALPAPARNTAIAAQAYTTLRLGSAALLIAVLLGLLTSRWLLRPILRINQAANALARGDWQQRVGESRAWELDLLGRSFNRMASELEQSFHWLEYGAYHDTLTGLLNRNALQSGLQSTLAWRESLDQPPLFAVLFLDLDYFKRVNDSLGHLTGDQLLLAVAQRLKQRLRQLNADSLDPTERQSRSLLARFGGDEFVVVLDPVRDSDEAQRAGRDLLRSLQAPFLIDEHEVFSNASLGVVVSNGIGEQADSLLRNADLALYRAKSEGRSTLALFDYDLHRVAVRRLELETELRLALQQQALTLHYQPIVRVEDQQIVGMEALARWHHGQLGEISPSEFIPIAEETGMILKLGWWALEAACQQLQDWRSRTSHAQTMVLSVNLSSRQFFQADCIERIAAILERTQVPPQQLKLEITESLFIYAIEETAAKLQKLRDMGLQLSIDDFGTGYSSLSYLHRFPLTTLKIDRSFISQLSPGKDYGAIVEAIVVLAHKLTMDVIAEGVETPEQLGQLQRMGCEQIQGFLFSPPLPAEAMARLLHSAQPLSQRSPDELSRDNPSPGELSPGGTAARLDWAPRPAKPRCRS